MKFNSALKLIAEATKETVDVLNKMEEYFDNGGFKELYPKLHKRYIDHVRRENYMYKKKNGTYFALLIILKNKTKEEDRDNIIKTIKDLEVIKDNKCSVERNGIIIKVLIKDIIGKENK